MHLVYDFLTSRYLAEVYIATSKERNMDSVVLWSVVALLFVAIPIIVHVCNKHHHVNTPVTSQKSTSAKKYGMNSANRSVCNQPTRLSELLGGTSQQFDGKLGAAYHKGEKPDEQPPTS